MAIKKEITVEDQAKNDTIIKTEEVTSAKQEKELNMNDKTKVVNLCSWDVSWVKINSIGDETIKANGSVYIPNYEIESQVNNGNVFICGTGSGDHARVYVDNKQLRDFLMLNDGNILNDVKCKEILEVKTEKQFKALLEKYVVTNQEKRKIIDYAKSIKFDSYNRIVDIEEHTEMKFK